MGPSDAEVVERCRDGDPKAFERLVRRYTGRAHAVAMGVLADPDEAADVCQDAFVTALERLDGLAEPSKFGSWFLSSVRNRAIDVLRSARFRKHVALDDLRPMVSDDEPARDANRSQLRSRLSQALQTLPDREREIVILHDVEGMKHREIAALLDTPEGTVRYLLSRARSLLRERLDPELLRDLT